MASPKINHVTVVGAGIMGSGIAMITAANGYQVTVVDLNEEALARGRHQVEKDLQRMAMHVSKGNEEKANQFYLASLARLNYSASLEKVLSATDLVIEAIVENLEKKQALFKIIDHVRERNVMLVEKQ